MATFLKSETNRECISNLKNMKSALTKVLSAVTDTKLLFCLKEKVSGHQNFHKTLYPT